MYFTHVPYILYTRIESDALTNISILRRDMFSITLYISIKINIHKQRTYFLGLHRVYK